MYTLLLNKTKNERAISTLKDGVVLATIDAVVLEIILYSISDSGLAGVGIFFMALIGLPIICAIIILVKNIITYKNIKDFLVRILLSTLWFLLSLVSFVFVLRWFQVIFK